MKNTRKGFTLVELLAVIVILAIIMIIAIPAVLSTMQTARQKSFAEYVTKVYTSAQNQYMTDKATGVTYPTGRTWSVKVGGDANTSGQAYTCYSYDIKKDIGLTSTGEFFGDVVICEAASSSNGSIQILVRLSDKSYRIKENNDTLDLWNYTKSNEPKADEGNVLVGTKTGGFTALTTDAIGKALQ